MWKYGVSPYHNNTDKNWINIKDSTWTDIIEPLGKKLSMDKTPVANCKPGEPLPALRLVVLPQHRSRLKLERSDCKRHTTDSRPQSGSLLYDLAGGLVPLGTLPRPSPASLALRRQSLPAHNISRASC